MQLVPLVFEEQYTATRFSWLLADIIEQAPGKVAAILPYLWAKRAAAKAIDFEVKFAKYWYWLGAIGETQEGEALDVFLQHLMNPRTKISYKTYIMLCLQKLAEKYPEVENELKICIKAQLEVHQNVSFVKVAQRVLAKMG